MTFKEILEYRIFSINDDKISLYVYELVSICVVLFIGYVVDRLIKRVIYKSDKIGDGEKHSFYQIIHYLIVIIAFFGVFKSLGVDISPLLMGSSAILVGIGLGMQGLVLDFISGVIVLLDRPVRVGDMIDVDGVVGKVSRINIRTTTVITAGNKVLYLPNSYLTKNKLINFSQNDDFIVYTIDVGVDYNSDLEMVKSLMVKAAKENPEVLKSKEPFVRLENFGESSLDLRLYFFSENLSRGVQISSDVREAILKKFRENNVVIPYPRRVLEIEA